jgi:hypothetical protein
MDIQSLLSAILYKNSLVGRASVQWGGRPRPPTDMAARDGRPTNTSHFFMYLCVRKEMIVRMACLEARLRGWLAYAVYFTWKVTVLVAPSAREMTNL